MAAWHLHELTAGSGPGHVRAVLLGRGGDRAAPGQGSYAAANTFLDALAAHRRGAGAARDVAGVGAVGAGQRDGRAADGDGLASGWPAQGLRAAGRGEGLALLDAAAGAAEPLLVPAPMDCAALRARGDGAAAAAVGPGPRAGAAAARRAVAGAGAGAGWRRGWRGWRAAEREAVVLRAGAGAGGRRAGACAGPEAVDAAARTFRELGFDSLTAVELRNRLGAATGLRLPATLVFDYPTPEALAAFVRVGAAGRAAAATGPRRWRCGRGGGRSRW